MLPADRRKEELEKKRAKLAELRKNKEARKTALDAQRRDPVGVGAGAGDRRDLDDLVSSLVGERSFSQSPSRDELRLSTPSPSFMEMKGLDESPRNSGTQSPVAPEPRDVEAKRPSTLSFTSADFVFLDVAPKEKVMYTKEIQTEAVDSDYASGDEVEAMSTTKLPVEGPLVISEPAQVDAVSDTEPPPISLTEDEKKTIVTSDRFLEFFDHSSKLIERALNETSYDFMKDYTVNDERVVDDSEGKDIKHVCTFADERWTRNRVVTDCSWSQKHPELVLASYSKNTSTMSEADGTVLIWNLHLRERPEYIFQSQSDVTVAVFSEFHPNLVIGGTYSGQILMWDMRSKGQPVLKTPLSAAGHTHPIYSMSIIGTQNAHNLLTASTDGLVCSWQFDMLAQPQEALDLLHPASANGISVTTMAFPYNETTTFWVGTEEGSIHQANRYDRAGSKAGVNPNDVYKGHHGMVTGLDFHPMSGPADFSDLFLTSSADWTVKLWRAKSASKTSSKPQAIDPLYSFEDADEYVYDVKWSPIHPSLFGCVNGSGRFDLYDLNREVEVPTASVTVGSGKALNKLAWDKEARRVATGTSDGQLYVYDLGEISQPRPDEWNAFQRTIAELESR